MHGNCITYFFRTCLIEGEYFYVHNQSCNSNGITTLNNRIINAYNKVRVSGKRKYICYAPFTNMYFLRDGKAIVCCHNLRHVIGRFPDKSIKEIWKSEKADEIRQFIANNDLSAGCELCRVDFENENFDFYRAVKFDNVPVHTSYPTMMEFELGNNCNLECVMCSSEHSSCIEKKNGRIHKYQSPFDETFVNQLEEFIPFLQQTRFSGGEPFLMDIYYKIWNKIHEINPNCNIEIQTNGTVLNRRVKDLLNRGRFNLYVSLDSLQKASYESIRKNADFEQTMLNINYFHDYCRKKGTYFRISICAMQQNWKEIPDLINFCNKLESIVWISVAWLPPQVTLQALNSKQLKDISNYLSSYNLPEDTPTQQQNKRYYSGFIKLVDLWYEDALKIEGKGDLYSVSLKEIFLEKIEHNQKSTDSLTIAEKRLRNQKLFQKVEKAIDRLPNGDSISNAQKKVLISLQDEYLVDMLESKSESVIFEELEKFINC